MPRPCTPCLKNVPTYFCSMLVKYEPISMVGTSWKEHLIKLCKIAHRLIYVLTLKWQIELSTQYLHVRYNESLNSYKQYWPYCLKNRQICSRSRHLYIICSKCLPLARTQACRRWRYVANLTFNEQHDSDCSLVFDASSQFVDIWYLGTLWRRTFRAYRR